MGAGMSSSPGTSTSVVRPAVVAGAKGVEVTWVHALGGCSERPRFAAAIRPDTALVALMFANNETGILQPVSEVSGIEGAAGARPGRRSLRGRRGR